MRPEAPETQLFILGWAQGGKDSGDRDQDPKALRRGQRGRPVKEQEHGLGEDRGVESGG